MIASPEQDGAEKRRKQEKKENTWWFTQKSKWQGIVYKHLTVLLYHHQRRKQGEIWRGSQERGEKSHYSTQKKTPNKLCFLVVRAASVRLSIQPPCGFFKWDYCSALIDVVLFVSFQAGPGRGGSIKTKKGQFDGCLLISRPLRLWLPNIKPAITDQSSHLHLHTPSRRIGSNGLFLAAAVFLVLARSLSPSRSVDFLLFSPLSWHAY